MVGRSRLFSPSSHLVSLSSEILLPRFGVPSSHTLLNNSATTIPLARPSPSAPGDLPISPSPCLIGTFVVFSPIERFLSPWHSFRTRRQLNAHIDRPEPSEAEPACGRPD